MTIKRKDKDGKVKIYNQDNQLLNRKNKIKITTVLTKNYAWKRIKSKINY